MEAESKNQTTKARASSHQLHLQDKRNLSLTGVKAVPTFTDKGMHIELDGETLIVNGQDLEIKTLDVDSGILTVRGFITSIRYTGTAAKGGLIKKIFK
jgi:sporulation protein YabP